VELYWDRPVEEGGARRRAGSRCGDVMTRMRGIDPFPQLWKRRTTLALPDGSECDLQRSGSGRVGQARMAKLFDVAKITDLKKAGQKFVAALPAHNPDDSAMVEIFATLPKTAEKS